MPASFSARSTASTASRSSERPESLENSVAPMPAMATCPENEWALTAAAVRPPAAARHRAGDVVAQVVGATEATVTSPYPSAVVGQGPFSVTEPVSVMVQSG